MQDSPANATGKHRAASLRIPQSIGVPCSTGSPSQRRDEGVGGGRGVELNKKRPGYRLDSGVCYERFIWQCINPSYEMANSFTHTAWYSSICKYRCLRCENSIFRI